LARASSAARDELQRPDPDPAGVARRSGAKLPRGLKKRVVPKPDGRYLIYYEKP